MKRTIYINEETFNELTKPKKKKTGHLNPDKWYEDKADFSISSSEGDLGYAHVVGGDAGMVCEEVNDTDLHKYIESYLDFLERNDYNINPRPAIEFNNEQQDGMNIRTGYYDPDERKVVVFINGRHVKDILRSFAHEMVHHMQNLRDEHMDWGHGGDLVDDDRLRELEGEAYHVGNILFREWTEELKKTRKLDESKFYGQALKMEESRKSFETWYRGYKAKYGSDYNHLLWLTDDIDYARSYGNRVEEVILDEDRLNPISVTDLMDDGYDYFIGPSKVGCKKMLSEGYNCYYFEANDDSSYCMCLWDKSAIVSRRELSREEFDQIEGYEGYSNPGYDTELNEAKALNESVHAGSNLDEFWNGDGDEMDFIYPEVVPNKLYHISPVQNRESILRNGLVPSVGDEYYDWWSYEGPEGEFDDLSDMPELVFLTSSPNTWQELVGGNDYDLYEVDVNQLDKDDITLDPTPSLARKGCYCYGQVIPPRAVKLIKTSDAGQGNELNETRKKVIRNDEGKAVPETCDKCGGDVVVQIHGEPVYVCKKCGKYFGTMPCNLNESFDISKKLELLKNRRDPDGIEDWGDLYEATENDVDLSSFKVQDKLNPKIWVNDLMDSRVRLKLLDIAQDFVEFLDVTWVKPEDTIVVGSIANYNWSRYSDIDLHIVMDYSKVDERKKFVENYFQSKKKEWNDTHDKISIFGFPVELYVQDKDADNASSAVYSIDKNKWLKKPTRNTFTKKDIDSVAIKKKASKIMTDIEDIEDADKDSNDEYKNRKLYDRSSDLIDNITDTRKKSLSATKDEMNTDNLVFKVLRRNGYLEKLFNLRDKTYDKMNSLD